MKQPPSCRGQTNVRRKRRRTGSVEFAYDPMQIGDPDGAGFVFSIALGLLFGLSMWRFKSLDEFFGPLKARERHILADMMRRLIASADDKLGRSI